MANEATAVRNLFRSLVMVVVALAVVLSGTVAASAASHAPKALGKPRNLHVMAVHPSVVVLQWKAPRGVRAFRVQFSENASMTSAKYRNFTSSKARVSGLRTNARYFFRVRSVAGPRSHVGSPYTEKNQLSVVVPAKAAVTAPISFAGGSPTPSLPVPSLPSLPVPSLPVPSLPVPSIPVPSIPVPSIPVPSIPVPSIPVPSIPVPSIPVPSTPAPSTPVPSTPAPSTPAPSTPVPSTPVPSTPVPSTPVPSTPVPSTPVPSTPVPSTPAPSTPAPSTPAPSTPASFQLRVTKPNGSNTGVGVIRSAPTAVASSADGTWSNGVLTITKDLKDKVVNGTVKIGANNLTIENCDIRGDAANQPTSDRSMVNTQNYSGTVVRYNDLHSTFSNEYMNGIGPRNVVAEFNNLYHLTDGFKPAPASSSTPDVNMVIRGNYVHDFIFWGHSAQHTATPMVSPTGVTITGPWAGQPWNHADGIQVEVAGTTGLTIYGNNIVATWANDSMSTLPLPNAVEELSVMMINAGTNLVIEDNWFDGGLEAINNSTTTATGTIARNRFGRSMGFRGTGDSSFYALMMNSPGINTNEGTVNQNIFENTGAMVPRRHN